MDSPSVSTYDLDFGRETFCAQLRAMKINILPKEQHQTKLPPSTPSKSGEMNVAPSISRREVYGENGQTRLEVDILPSSLPQVFCLVRSMLSPGHSSYERLRIEAVAERN